LSYGKLFFRELRKYFLSFSLIKKTSSFTLPLYGIECIGFVLDGAGQGKTLISLRFKHPTFSYNSPKIEYCIKIC